PPAAQAPLSPPRASPRARRPAPRVRAPPAVARRRRRRRARARPPETARDRLPRRSPARVPPPLRTSAGAPGLDLDRLAGLDPDHLDVRRQLPQLVGRPGEQRKRPVVARDATAHAEQLERDGGLAGIHR